MAKLLRKSTVSGQLKELRVRSGLSMERLAQAIGFAGASSYQRYENSTLFTQPYLPLELAERLANAIHGQGNPPISKAEVMMLAGVELDERGRPTEYSVNVIQELAEKGLSAIEADLSKIRTEGLTGQRDFPIYASAQGGADGMVTDFEVVETVKRPEPLANAKRGFGMYVVGDSMEPAFRQGDTILCHPSMPPKSGDDVLIIKVSEDNSHSCLLKQFLSADDKVIRLRQYNPPDGRAFEFSVKRQAVQAIHVIVGKYARR